MKLQCRSLRVASFYVPAPLAGLLLLIACSSAEDGAPIENDGGDAAQILPDGGGPSESADGAADDAANDAGNDANELPPYDFAVACAGVPCITQIAARGGAHACAVLSDGSAWCWGANASGQLGTGSNDGGTVSAFEASPRQVLGVSNARGVATTGAGTSGTTCVVEGAGDVACFGSDLYGQLGQPSPGSRVPHPNPASIAGVQAKSVALTNTFALAIGVDDRLWSWGMNDILQLARSAADAGSVSLPALAGLVSSSVRSCAGTTKTGFVVDEDGAIASWGGGTSDQLGRGTSLDLNPVPEAVALSGVSSVVSGSAHACALSHGALYCWGQNQRGQLGTTRKADEVLPARVVLPAGVQAVAVAAGGMNTCAIVANGDLYCWGANGSGQVGTSAGLDEPTPTKIEGLGKESVGVAVMDASICSLLRDGSVSCWGDNLVGQLGRGSRDAEIHAAPAPVVFK